MKQMKQIPHFYAVLVLAAALVSCANQPQSIPEKLRTTNDAYSFLKASEVDTSLYLKFNSEVRYVFEDSRGNWWFASDGEGVCRFDGENLTYFTEDDGLTSSQIRTILEDDNGDIWFEGGRGLSSYDGAQITVRTDKDYSTKKNWNKGDGDLWFKGDESIGVNETEGAFGVYRYDGNKLIYHTFPIETKEEGYYSVSTPAVKGKDGTVWFGTYGAAIGFDGTSFDILDDERLGLNDETGHFHVRALFEDSKGNLWIGNNGIGVLHYDGETITNFSEEQALVAENSTGKGGSRSPGLLQHVFAIGEDRDGNMWFGDRDSGIWRYDPSTPLSTDESAMRNFSAEDGATLTFIWQIYQSKSGELLIAGGGGVLRFNGESFDRIF
jgi:ligand-binding sensor domain-containing protein